MIRDPVVDASSAPGMRFSLGRLRSWLPQSLVGRVIKPNPDARSRDADGNGDEDSMSVDLSRETCRASSRACPCQWPPLPSPPAWRRHEQCEFCYLSSVESVLLLQMPRLALSAL